MNYFLVYRNNYQDENSLFQIVSGLRAHPDSIYSTGLGINYLSEDAIFKGFKMILHQSFKYPIVKYHLLELRFMEQPSFESTIETGKHFSYLLFYEFGFAHYMTVIKEGDVLRCIYLISSISIKNWQSFSNRNQNYLWILDWLNKNTDKQWTFGSRAVLFDKEKPYVDNYEDIVL